MWHLDAICLQCGVLCEGPPNGRGGPGPHAVQVGQARSVRARQVAHEGIKVGGGVLQEEARQIKPSPKPLARSNGTYEATSMT
eukprot:1157985-Pelagomonas_calceolata.AAC.5